MLEYLRNIDWKKAFLAIASWWIIISIVLFFAWVFKNYVTLDFSKASKYFNTQIFGKIFSLILLYSFPVLFDFGWPGQTLSTLMNVGPTSNPEDKRNATNLFCAIFVSTAWVISYS